MVPGQQEGGWDATAGAALALSPQEEPQSFEAVMAASLLQEEVEQSLEATAVVIPEQEDAQEAFSATTAVALASEQEALLAPQLPA
ncbi:MAG: hypothetical protein RL648_1100 [Verrucomicrobiota bacterium]